MGSPNGRKSNEFVGGEELEGGEGAEVPLVRAVGGPREAGEVVAEVFAVEEGGEVGEDNIVGEGEALANCGGR